MAQKVMAYDDTEERLVRTDKDPATIGTGGVEGTRAGSDAVADGTTSLAITFSSALADASYTVNVNFFNTTDTDPLFQSVMIKNKTTTGFTAFWNFPVDTTNYEITYAASPFGAATAAGSEAIASSATSKSITLSPAQSNTDYAVNANFQNSTDSNPIFQPISVSSKATTGFTVEWNVPTDTANYLLEFHIATFN
jgi:hypothetical protein